MIKVLGPDQNIYEFPDDATDAEIDEYLNFTFPAPIQEQVTEQPEDNVGAFSYLADIADRSKAISDAVNVFNNLRKVEDDDPNRSQLIKDFEEANKRIEFYSEEDNWFFRMGKSLAADLALTVGGAAAGTAVAGPVGTVVGAGATGFTLGREQNKIFNAYRELQETGDLTSEELKGAVDTAIIQAGLEGAADAFTGGFGGAAVKTAGKLLSKEIVETGIGKTTIEIGEKQKKSLTQSLLKKVATDAALGGTAEVGNAMLQRGYVSNLEVFGPGALEEYLRAGAEGAVAQAILSGTFRAMEGKPQQPANDTDGPITETELLEAQQDGFLNRFAEDKITAEDLRSKLDEYQQNPNVFRLDKAQDKLNEINKKLVKRLDDGSMERIEPDDETKAIITDLNQKIDKYILTPNRNFYLLNQEQKQPDDASTAYRGVRDINSTRKSQFEGPQWAHIYGDNPPFSPVWFTPDQKLAREYRKSYSVQYAPGVIKKNINFKNPLIFDAKGAVWNMLDYDDVVNQVGWNPEIESLGRASTDQVLALAKEKGHDGIIIKNVRDEPMINNDFVEPKTIYGVLDGKAISDVKQNFNPLQENDSAGYSRGTADLFKPEQLENIPVNKPKYELKKRNEKPFGLTKITKGYDEYSIVSKKSKYITDTEGKKHKIDDVDDPVANIVVHKKTGDVVVDDVLQQDALHEVFSFAATEGRQVRSKSAMNKKEFDMWSSYVKGNSDILFDASKPVVDKDGTYRSENKQPLFKTKEIPQVLKQPYVTKMTNKTKTKPTTVNRDGFFRVDEEARVIEDTLLRAFGDNPNTKFTITGLSDKALKEFAASKEYKAFTDLAKKRKSIEILRAADAMTTETADAINSKVNHTVIPNTSFGNMVAKHAQELLEPLKPLLEAGAGIETLSKNFGSKPPSNEIKTELNSWWPKGWTPAQTLASKSGDHAEIMGLGRQIQNVKDSINHVMRHHARAMKKSMKNRNTWVPAHEQLDLLDKFGGKLVDGNYVYTDTDGNVKKVPEHLTKDIKALDNYYKQPAIFTRMAKQRQLENVLKDNDADLAKLIKDDIDNLDKVLGDMYFPRRRFGDLMFKVGKAMYSIESIAGIDRLAPNANEKLADNLYVSKAEWGDFRQMIRKKHGTDIGSSAKKFYTDQLQGDVKDNTLFRMNMVNLKSGKFDRFLENEMIVRLLNDADKTKLEYFKRKAGGDSTLKRLLKPSEKIDGYSTDYDRIADDHYASRTSGWVNYLFEPALMKMNEKYMQNDTPQNSAEEYAQQVFGKDVSQASQAISRFQAFMALAFSPSTAALQWTSLVTTVPLVLSTAIGQTATTRAMLDPTGFSLFRKRLSDPDYLGNYDDLVKTSDKGFADFVIRNQRTFSNTQKAEYNPQYQQQRRILGKKLEQAEDLGHGMMLKVEEATRLQSAYAIHKSMRNPQNLARAKQTLKNDQRYQDLMRNRGDIPEADIITELLIDNAFGIYGKLGWANFQKNDIARLALPFISYPLQMTHVLADHLKGDRSPSGRAAAARMMMTMPVMFGMAGAPFFEWFDLAYKFANFFAGRGSRNIENDVFDAMYDINPDAARFLKKGVTGSAFGVDISKRVALGNPYSGITGAFTSNAPLGRDVGYLLPKASEMAKSLQDGDVVNFLEAASPIAFQNAFKALAEYPELLGQPGGALTKSGEVILPDDQIQADEIVKKLLGFQPMSVASANNAYYSAREEQNRYTGPKKRLAKSAYPYYKRWIESGQTDETARLRVVELSEDYAAVFRQNGDPFTEEKASGFTETLLNMYNNERGFTGGQTKANIPDSTMREALDRYKRTTG